MNRNHYLGAIVALAAPMLMTSCDEVSKDDRFEALPTVEAKRVVLLEEFTGQKCVNCPTAHKAIEGLMAQYPDNLISVSIHSGGSAFSIGENEIPGLIGLRLDEGETYAANFNVKSLPAGVINRTSGVLTYDQWGSVIRNEIAKPSVLDLEVSAKLLDDGKTIEIKTNASPYENISGHLQLWIVENGIVALQLQPDGTPVMTYEHNHVFRGTVNGIDGEPVTLTTRQPEEYTNTIAVKDNWNPAQLGVVAFVYNSNGVLQAAKAHLTTE